MELYFNHLVLSNFWQYSFVAPLGMSLTIKKVLAVVKESDKGMSLEYFLTFSKVIGPNNRKCARCCHCHVNLALRKKGLVTVMVEDIHYPFRAVIKWRSGLNSKFSSNLF